MPLITIGISHASAPLAVREQTVFAPGTIKAALDSLRDCFADSVLEAAIVSTCNRTELYCVLANAASIEPQALADWLTEFHRLESQALNPYLYTLTDGDAVNHAFRVASGLESMVIGEPQILGQFKQAVRNAGEAGALGTLLNQLFQRTFAVAKEVRTQTAIGEQSVSMAAAAVRVAEKIFSRLDQIDVLCIGAGEMIDLTATHFAARSPRSLVFANRTFDRARAFADSFGGEAIALSALPERFSEFDVVVSCTASTLPIIGLGLVESALKTRRHRPVFIVDLAVPRDVEPEVAKLSDIYLYSIDDLGEIVREGGSARESAIAEAEVIIEARVHQFMHWLTSRQTVPLISQLRHGSEALRRDELTRALRSISAGASPAEALDELARRLTNKFLYRPLALMNQTTDPIERERLAQLIPRLFPTQNNQ